MNNKTVINYPLKTKDSKGNITHVKESNGYEVWREYDENDKIRHSQYSDGSKYWYDENGKIIHSKYSDGSEYWYDSKGNKIPNPNLVTERQQEEKEEVKKLKAEVKRLEYKLKDFTANRKLEREAKHEAQDDLMRTQIEMQIEIDKSQAEVGRLKKELSESQAEAKNLGRLFKWL